MKKKGKAIFFDRDGVLIKAPVEKGKPKSVKNLNKVELCQGIKDLCKQ